MNYIDGISQDLGRFVYIRIKTTKMFENYSYETALQSQKGDFFDFCFLWEECRLGERGRM
jgi:hypothetical protein